MGFFSKMLGRINARNRFRNAGNINKRFMPNMFGRMGGGIGSMFPRFRPPTIEEAKGRNMANVGLLPDYMQPGGSGIPPMEVGAPVDPATDRFNKAAEQLRSAAIMPRGPVMNRPRPPIGMAPFQQGRMAMGFEEGGEAKKYPNAGLAALAKEAPEVVERMGYQEGGVVPGIDMPSGSDADMMNYQNTLMALRKLKESLPLNQQEYFDSAVQEILGESGRTLSNLDIAIALGMAPAGALRSGIAKLNTGMMRKMPTRTISNRDREIIREVIPNEMD